MGSCRVDRLQISGAAARERQRSRHERACYRAGVCRLALLAVLGCATIAHAEPVVLRADQIQAVITAEIELAPRLVAEPVSLAPDVWFGVTHELTVGLIHSNASVSRIDRAASFCFEHHAIYGCDRTYHNAGLDARYAIRDGALSIAARARFLLRDVDPWKPALTAGALLRWTRGRIALTADPYLRIGLANTGQGNRTALYLPLVFGISPIEHLELRAHTGYDSDLAVWSDGFHVPLAFSARRQLTRSVELGALFGFTSAAGPQDTLGRRTLWFWFGWRSGPG